MPLGWIPGHRRWAWVFIYGAVVAASATAVLTFYLAFYPLVGLTTSVAVFVVALFVFDRLGRTTPP